MTASAQKESGQREWRILEAASAFAGLLLLTPVLAGIALWILCDDGRPVLFRQRRVGRRGQPFSILKFRTMRRDGSGPSITAAGDGRITRAGFWLRRFKLDELPQLVNVLRGDMSWIGPRPEVPEFVDFESAIWREVLEVRPGITDLATLVYRNEEDLLRSVEDPERHYRSTVLPAKLALNLGYLHSRSLRSDLRLLFYTARYSFFPHPFDGCRLAEAICAEPTTYVHHS